MARQVKVAAAQMGPINEGTSRDEVVERMLVLLEQAITEQVELIAYPEMALTTYFPKRIRDDYDQFFETEVPPKALEPLLRRAREDGRGRATSASARRPTAATSTPRCSPMRPARWSGPTGRFTCPGVRRPDGFAQVYEVLLLRDRRHRLPVFPTAQGPVGIAICQDRRYPESYRCLGLQGADIVLIGYNTPLSAAGARPQRARPARGRLREQPASWSASPRPASRTAWS